MVGWVEGTPIQRNTHVDIGSTQVTQPESRQVISVHCATDEPNHPWDYSLTNKVIHEDWWLVALHMNMRECKSNHEIMHALDPLEITRGFFGGIFGGVNIDAWSYLPLCGFVQSVQVISRIIRGQMIRSPLVECCCLQWLVNCLLPARRVVPCALETEHKVIVIRW